MKRFLVTSAAALAACMSVSLPAAIGRAGSEAQPVFGIKIYPGYRDWKLISIAHEAGELDDLRAILGNDIAVEAFRQGKQQLPDGAVIVRLAWAYTPSQENNRVFGKNQSFIAGPPKEGVQFMVKDSTQYAATGGWGFAQFNDGEPIDAAAIDKCFPCHEPAKGTDFVFTRYAP